MKTDESSSVNSPPASSSALNGDTENGQLSEISAKLSIAIRQCMNLPL